MDELVQFLRARLDEDEQAATAASPGPWHVNAEGDEVLAVDDITVADGFALSERQLRATTQHIARHDPARVLAGIDAKQAIISMYEAAGLAVETAAGTVLAGGAKVNRRAYGNALQALALPYADHPDYRQEWRP